jgi:hypothetical protein
MGSCGHLPLCVALQLVVCYRALARDKYTILRSTLVGQQALRAVLQILPYLYITNHKLSCTAVAMLYKGIYDLITREEGLSGVELSG